MAGRPVDVMAKGRKLRGHQGYWTVVRTLGNYPGCFTVHDVFKRVEGRKDSVRDYINRLERAGYVRRMPETGCAAHWTVIRDAGASAPRLRRDGSAVIQGRGQDNMWRAMKMLHEFTARELSMVAATEETPVSLDTAKRYIGHLSHAGYLVTRRAGGGPQGTLYQLHPGMNTGPRAPMVQRFHRVFDPNLGRVMSSDDGT